MNRKHLSFLLSLAAAAFLSLPSLPADAQEQTPEEKEKTDQPKKWALQLTLGVARISPGQFYYRHEGIERLELEYTAYYNLTATSSGVFKQNKLMLPFHIMLHYRLKKNLFLEGGLEYAFNRGSGARSFRNQWPSLVEIHDYSVSHNLTYIMPRLGVGWQFKPRLQLYVAAGLGIASLRYDENFTLKVGNEAGLNRKGSYSATAIAPALIVGSCYHIDLKKKFITSRPQLLARLEFLLFTPSSFSGDRKITTSAGSSLSEGTIYQTDWDAFGSGEGFLYWEMFAEEPTGTEHSRVQPLKIDMSALRLLIGVSF